MGRKIIFVIASVIFILSIFIYFNFFRGITQDTNFLLINKVEVTENVIDLHASNPKSGIMISGIDKTYKNHIVYLKFRGALVNEYGKSIKDGKISIEGNYKDINKVVILGNNYQKKQIWER
ncbi:hypothetical protein [Bacillus sp. OAE603]|uniref:hypothetical protein n=1 Tax=Gottfriedia sp. OAE603 TaxID=2663872 RepID=UPI00178AADD6